MANDLLSELLWELLRNAVSGASFHGLATDAKQVNPTTVVLLSIQQNILTARAGSEEISSSESHCNRKCALGVVEPISVSHGMDQGARPFEWHLHGYICLPRAREHRLVIFAEDADERIRVLAFLQNLPDSRDNQVEHLGVGEALRSGA